MRQINKVAMTTISAALALTLTSCSGAGPDAATRMITRVTDGAEAVIDTNGYDIRISNLLLVATGDSTTVLVGNIVNRSAEQDQLLAISTRTTLGTITGQTILNANQPIQFEGSSANAKVIFKGEDMVPGTNVQVALGFARAGQVYLNLIVRDTKDIYAGVTANPLVAPSATPTAK
jgi:D-arabinose 1-dehydrogenase-like Zn-dependent alcohol dehydrogenase